MTVAADVQRLIKTHGHPSSASMAIEDRPTAAGGIDWTKTVAVTWDEANQRWVMP